MITTTTKSEALKIAMAFTGGMTKDENKSENAGYTIYVSDSDEMCWVSDLETRLEINFSNGKTTNIWIEDVNEIKNNLEKIKKELDYNCKHFLDMLIRM